MLVAEIRRHVHVDRLEVCYTKVVCVEHAHPGCQLDFNMQTTQSRQIALLNAVTYTHV